MKSKSSSQARWNEAHPLEMLAHQYVRSALRRGLLQRGVCEVCGEEKTDAHHDDYEQPRKVRWLCRRHHQQHHADRRKA
jgi:hypothetical protein